MLHLDPVAAATRRVFALAGAVVLAVAIPLAFPTATLGACTESTKFVQQVAGTNLYYGVRDTVYNFDHRPMCSVNAHSTFMRMSDDYRSWVEIGTSEDPDGTTHYWSEWRSYPNNAVVRYYDSQFGHPALNQWFSFMIQDEGGGDYSLWWQPGSDPSLSNWSFLGMSDPMPRNVGELESEEARFGDANANHDAYYLASQNRFHSGFNLWTNLQCDWSQNSITDWKAIKDTNYSWYTDQATSGLC